MQVTEYIVATHNERGDAGLFRLVYGSGQVPGVESVRAAVGTALRRAGMRTEDGFVIFDASYPCYEQLGRCIRGAPIALDGTSPNDRTFGESITQHPDFLR